MSRPVHAIAEPVVHRPRWRDQGDDQLRLECGVCGVWGAPDTDAASVVALGELLHTARLAQSLVYNPTPIVAAALIYLVLLWPAVRFLSRLEHRHVASR